MQHLTEATPSVPTVGPSLPVQSGTSPPGSRQLTRDSSLHSISRNELRLFGNEVPHSVKVCVGFGSVKRKKDYILDTVGTMLGLRGGGVLSQSERDMVVVATHLADYDTSWVSSVSTKLQTDYKDLVKGGHFHALHAPIELYPKLDVCPPFCAYKDEPHRVRWRSKQNVDYAFLMYYAAPLAPYYVQIEDDLAFAPNWIGKMMNYVNTQYPPNYLTKENTPWRLINFSELGFIGKMFQSNELTRLAQFLLLFYDQMPCDLLLGEWVKSMTQSRRIEYWKQAPSLFQHIGIFRSLGGYQPLQEKTFGKPLFDNPVGLTAWNMLIMPTYEGRFSYWSGGEPSNRNDMCDFKASNAHAKTKMKRCWFWAKRPAKGQHMTIVFQHDIKLKAVFMEFGHEKHPKDLLKDGVLQVAATASTGQPYSLPMPGQGDLTKCGAFYDLIEVKATPMVYWEEGASVPPAAPVPMVRCLRISMRQNQDEWLVVFNILVRTT